MGKSKAPRNAYCSFCRKSYRDVGPLVEGPGEVYICGECIELCQSIIEQEKRRRSRSAGGTPAVPAPEVIRERLDRLVLGQDEVKAALVQAALRRYERSDRGSPGPVLLIGPARSSRALLPRALAHALEVPFVGGDAHALLSPEAGQIEPLLAKLLLASGYDAEAAQRGIVYVDGVDQVTAQEVLLRLWEREAGGVIAQHLQIDLARPLFVCGGEFAGLDEVLTGMGRHPEQPVPGEALRAFGVTPDFVGRLQAVVRVPPLDDAALARIVPWVDLDRMAGAGA